MYVYISSQLIFFFFFYNHLENMSHSVNNKRTADELDMDQQPPVKKPVHSFGREPSIFNIKPVDDVIKYIAEFIGKHCNLDNVEIEAKLGVFVDKATNKRLNIEAFTETVLPKSFDRSIRFESNMALEQHRHFNKMLNDMVNKTQNKEYRGERIQYKHTNEVDRFYSVPNSYSKWRVTTDASGKVVPNGIVEKERVADLNIHSPNQPLDFRISVNIEHPRPKPNGDHSFERSKDRISYKHGGISFDLTQVKTTNSNDPNLRHELELEIINSKALAEEKLKYNRKEPSQYIQLVEVFVNNIRLLGRSALKQQQ
ncbi:CYTH-like domain-containing protein [Sporodiniella umbellata]|nr:CYTH-like domain-containing protein [Sporodiniella umbellata]